MPIFHQIWINLRRCIDDKKNVSVNLTFLTFQVMFCTMHGNKIGFIITSEINQAKLTMSKVFLTKLKETVSVISMQRGKCPIYNSTLSTFVYLLSTEICVCKLLETRSAANSSVRCFVQSELSTAHTC